MSWRQQKILIPFFPFVDQRLGGRGSHESAYWALTPDRVLICDDSNWGHGARAGHLCRVNSLHLVAYWITVSIVKLDKS